MISPDATAFQDAIRQMIADGKLPPSLTPRQRDLLAQSFAKYSGEVGQKTLDAVLSEFEDKISQSLNSEPSIAGERSDLLYNLTANVGADIADKLQFGMDIAQEVIAGAGRYLNQNLSPEAVDEYPALALTRYFRRTIPRGWKRIGKTVVPVPDDNWPSRWEEARSQTEGTDSLPWSGDSQGGRGVALKSSPIWGILGSLRDDSLGNPFPPFAFNSGFMTQEISRKQTEALGLLAKGQPARPAPVNFEQLFSELI